MGDIADMHLEQMYDGFWDDEFYDMDTPSPREEYQWISNGVKMRLKDMSDKHLQNAIRYSKDKESQHAYSMLVDEQTKRNLKKVEDYIDTYSQPCQYCDCQMTYQKFDENYDPFPDVGFDIPHYVVQLTCEGCGASGPKSDEADFNERILKETKGQIGKKFGL